MDFAQTTGLTKLGIETGPAIATRGIVLDMAGLKGTAMLTEGTPFNRADIEAAMKRQGIKSIEKGDVVLFYTGWPSLIGKEVKRYGSFQPGLRVEVARHLSTSGLAAPWSATLCPVLLPVPNGS